MNFWNNPNVVSKVPILTTALLESANISQIHRMWSEHTAAGQSIVSWIMVNIALILWLRFYYMFNYELKWTRYATIVGIAINACVILSVIKWRYF